MDGTKRSGAESPGSTGGRNPERFQSVVVVVSPALQDRCKTFRRRCRQFYSIRQMYDVPSLLLSVLPYKTDVPRLPFLVVGPIL